MRTCSDRAWSAAQIRGTLLTASQCATYDDTKRAWMRLTGWQDGLATHVGVSMITGAPALHVRRACRTARMLYLTACMLRKLRCMFVC